MTIIACLTGATLAHGQALPKVDPQKYCARRPPPPGFSADDALAFCLDDENASLDVLRENWATYGADSKRRCLKSHVGPVTYSNLQACLIAAESRKATAGW
jgi:hypothetical protein